MPPQPHDAPPCRRRCRAVGRPPLAAATRRLAAGVGLALLACAVAQATGGEPPAELVERAARAWQRRAEGRQALAADPRPIGEAVEAYTAALAAAPHAWEVRELLLRALYFQGRFASDSQTERRAAYATGRDLAEDGLERLAAPLGGRRRLEALEAEELAGALPDRRQAAALYFWGAAHWGLWGETSGAMAAARRGVVGKVRRYAELVAQLDESYEAAGGYRILGRLHSEAPRIPFVTGWIDRDLAVDWLRRAVELAPGEPLNRLYLADALLRFRPAARGEALALLDGLLAEPPRPATLLEDEAVLLDARAVLATARGR